MICEKQSRTAIAAVSMRRIQRQGSLSEAFCTSCAALARPRERPSFTVSTAKLHQIFSANPPKLTRLAFPRATSETGGCAQKNLRAVGLILDELTSVA